MHEQLRALALGAARPSAEVLDPSYWARLEPSSDTGRASERAEGRASSEGFCAAGRELRSVLRARGFGVASQLEWASHPASPASLAAAIDRLGAEAWPPVFAFLLDATWAAVDPLFALAEGVLGEEARLPRSLPS